MILLCHKHFINKLRNYWVYRSALIAAFIVINCVTWTASRHHFTHNGLGHRSRHRRQGAGLYLASSYVLPGGEGTGAWGPWGEVSPCSRTCGGGVASQKRICLELGGDGQPRCTGGDTKYFSCQTQDCPAGSRDFRSEQCSEFDSVSFKGNHYNWVPYTKAPNPCELNCMPRGERFYYRQKEKVVDGTRCNDETFDVCVDGACQPVGCDMMLGSNAKEDKCRECRGNGTNCHTISGRIDSQDLRQGYNDVLLIPQGATSIAIAEVRASNNYLALRSKYHDVYYLNGDYHIDFPRTLVIAGALWHYERSQQGFAAPDKLRCLGPTTEPLYLSLLLQDVNVGIDYEYSVPTALAPPPNQQYNWVHDEFTPCSATCGGGFQTRNVTCRSREELQVVDESLCDDGLKPATNQTCATTPCAAHWEEGPWSPCSKLCGGGGTRSRQVYCEKIITNGQRSIVDDKECFSIHGPKPELFQECNQNASCPSWFTGPWKPCDKLCGEGKQTRQVVCHQKLDGKVDVLPDEQCVDEKPPAEQGCFLHPCEGVDWVISDWSGCDNCLSKLRTRNAECATKDRKVVNSSLCSYHPLPVLEEECDKTLLPPCTVQWYATQWSNCSVQCGKGVQTRRIFCGLFDGSSVIKVDDNRCENETKYKDTKPCEVPDEKCPAKWFAGPWSECTKTCGGGEQFRRVMCLSGGKEAKDCDEKVILDSNQPCNGGPCDKDETLPVDATATTVMDEDEDYDECTDEEVEEEEDDIVGLDEAEKEEDTSTTIEDFMFSDSPSTYITEESSGTGSTELESEFTSESGSGSEPTFSTDSLTTESSGSEPTDVTEETSETSSTEQTETEATSESGSTETAETGSTDVSEMGDTVTTEVSPTAETGSETSVSDSETTESGSTTESASETASTEGETSDASTTENSKASTEESTTEIGTELTTDSSTTESGTSESSTTEEGSTTESGTTETGTSDVTGTTESGATETTEVAETGSTSSTETEETGSTVTEETGSTETSVADTGTTETGETGSTTESGATETTETGETSSTESTSEGYSTTESESSTISEDTTPWDFTTTIETFTKKDRCKPRKKISKCIKAKFGCCPDKRTPAAGPFDEGCPNPKTCKESKFGCCPDGVSPAQGPKFRDCPVAPCNETLYGCCKSDNKTAAEGNGQEGCPPPPPKCKSSKHGCCKDGKTQAKGPKKQGCPEKESKKKPTGCAGSEFGCCHDNQTAATGPDAAGCPCNATEFGCCPDGVSAAGGLQMEGCVMSCNTSAFGCCADGETPAHGPDHEGCCLQYSFGCCPDNYKPAEGPHLEGCGCQYAHFGCCPDDVTIARGPNKEGCGCQYTEFGCCPDRHTEASGPSFEGCGCHTYQFGCCPDGTTIAKGPNLQGCHCSQSTYGCCGDGQTAAKGPEGAGCDCSSSKYGCCPDGQTEAQGEKFLGCTDVPENRQAGCSLKIDRGPCRNYSVHWYYDLEYGGCSRFWYGGCDGNGNRFSSKDECEDVCVHPAPKDACNLPKVKGACVGYHYRWYYDAAREQCGQFVFGGCLGNGNNFETREVCQAQCEPARSEDQCKLPIERGSCAGNFSRWGYSAGAGRCEQFIWGGCEGNGNRFGSEAACVQRCDPPGALKPACTLAQERGNCTEKQARWAFSQTENRCLPFYYTGCGGNDNNFRTEQECVESCPSAYVQETCTLPAETGECADYRERWYYDTAVQRCRQFYYGGCGGNKNNFVTERECEARCQEQAPPATTPRPASSAAPARPAAPEPFRQEFCFDEKDPGPCSQSETRWAYDPAAGACAPFQYGGCGGNRNNFPSQEYCSYYCSPVQDVCQLAMSAGPCSESLMRWFYDPSSDSCSQFTYGGCEGNDNRFESRDECERRCRAGPQVTPATSPTPAIAPRSPEAIPRECEVVPTPESCPLAGRVWHYEASRRECAEYDNGAGGECRRAGAFPSPEACERTCGTFKGLEVCRYPVDPGPCTEMQPKFYFDASSGQCQSFTYGGCHGGPNRFSTVEECRQICGVPEASDPCSERADPGPCSESQVQWYYDAARDSCSQFVFGGCGGNGNRFPSREECEGTCRREQTTTTTLAPATPALDAECQMPESLEACGENATAYYYDASQQLCRAAAHGRCRHANAYRTEEQCERACGAFRGRDPCRAYLDPGPCRASIAKFYYDQALGRCQEFAWGGCGGGPNRFSDLDECEEVCASIQRPEARCLLAVSAGFACEAGSSRRWYYSSLDGDCVAFVYQGCGGNQNNFPSYRDCLDTCRPEDNEVVPECARQRAECAALACPWGVQRVRAGACERCACVTVETDCGKYAQECQGLKCAYGTRRTVGEDGCERCTCIDHPCAGKECPEGERCVATALRDPYTQELSYSADCKIVNKGGSCPAAEPRQSPEEQCRRECNDDADCRDANKCCVRGCSQLCLATTSDYTTPFVTEPPTTPYVPELPQRPQPDSKTKPEVSSEEGGKATLRCLFHSNPPPRITWRRGEVTIDGTVGRYRLQSDGALEIVSLFRNDSGVYICVADNGLGVAQQEIRLQVNDPVELPAAISGDPDATLTGDLGYALEIRCLAYGYPAPTIAWYRGPTGPMVPYSSQQYEARDNVLLIRSLDTETLGEYTCQAYNGIGKPASWTAVVQAWRPAGAPPAPHLVARGPEVLVTPRPVATPPAQPPTQPPPPPIVYNVPVSTRIPLDFPQFPTGGELSLPCEVDGYPTPDVSWSKDGQPLVNTDRVHVSESRLTISHLVAEDSGSYRCYAANAFSSHYSAVQISVEGTFIPPTCTDSPFFANCQLIVRSKYCHHKYYSKFCCKSCMEAGQLRPEELQAEQFRYK